VILLSQGDRNSDKEPDIQIQNVVASASIPQKLKLKEIAEKAPNARYEPERFPGLIYKIKKPKAALLIFSSGRFVCTGTKSIGEAAEAINKALKQMNEYGIKVEGKPLVKAENIVASAKIHSRIDIEKVATELPDTLYEPEQFPGLIYRMNDPKVVFLIFASGSLVCTGAKKEEDVKKAVYKLKEILKENGMLIPE